MDIRWLPNHSSNTPLYLQIAEHIKNMIKYGYYPAGQKLSERSLASEYKVSRGTVVEALELLKSGGQLAALPKKGTVVAEDAWSKLFNAPANWQNLVSGGRQIPNEPGLREISSRSSEAGIITLSGYALNNKLFEPYKPLMQAMADMAAEPGAFTSSFWQHERQGFTPLREAVARYVSQEHSIKTDPKNIIIFNSYNDAMSAVFNALLSRRVHFYAQENDMILVMGNLATVGVNQHPIPSDGAGISLEEIERKISVKNQNILYLNPVNHWPTGTTLSSEKMGQLAVTCKKLKVPIIENDMLRDLWVTPPPPPLKSTDIHQQIIYLGTMPNLFLSGLRLAWCIAPASTIERLCDVKVQYSGPNNQATEALYYIMLEKGYYKECIQSVRAKMPERLFAVNTLMHKHLNGIASWDERNMNYLVWVEFDKKIDSFKLFRELRDFHFLTGNVYTKKQSSAVLLTTLSTPLDILDKGLEALASAVRSKL